MADIKKHLILPELPVNNNGWGPVENLKLFNGMPYQSFNKNDRLGMVCDLSNFAFVLPFNLYLGGRLDWGYLFGCSIIM